MLLTPGGSGGVREYADPVGFSTTREQIESVIEHARLQVKTAPSGEVPARSRMLSAICPHDDHIYAGSLYLPVMERVNAEHLILIGVFHRAWKYEVEDVLVFDDFESWKGPYGPLTVDGSFRKAVLAGLSGEDFLVSSDYHAVEHSLEAFVGFIQHFDRKASILPILIPYMNWDRLDKLAGDLAEAVAKVMKKNGWQLGRDVQILISNDSSHYGDQGWEGKDYAPFGSGPDGLAKAKERDLSLIREHLLGEPDPIKLRSLMYNLVDENDIHDYLITWCGRFSVPFGVDLTRHLATELGLPAPHGHLLGYGTSVELGELPVRDLGLGVTAPANLHHWVAYTSVGYFAPQSHY